MRTETIAIYQYSELNPVAKQAAIENYRTSNTDFDWLQEWLDSLRAFCDALHLSNLDYSIGAYCDSFASASLNCEDSEELTGLRLRTWLVNNWQPALERRAYKGIMRGNYEAIPFRHRLIEWHKGINGFYAVKRAAFAMSNDCALTGYAGDNALTAPIFDFIAKPDNRTLGELLTDCLANWVYQCQTDLEAQSQDDYIVDAIECNDYEFLANGDIH